MTDKKFSSALLRWYEKHKRDLPWRKTTDPYLIWLSEIILQQTRVSQGLPYFLKFRKKYPTVRKFAAAPQRDILKLWQGLGYYSRARNMHHTAKDIVKNYDGKFPADYSDLLKLKGVGEYTAAAISSICFGLAHPVVDGNVVRVLSRHVGIRQTIDSAAGKKSFVALASKLMANNSPSEFNQAMMEFGALQCVPKNPACGVCPLRKSCYAFKHSQVETLPVKKTKPKIRERYFDYLVIQSSGKVFLKKRMENDIWKNLFDFPVIESKKFISEAKLRKLAGRENILRESGYTVKPFSKTYRHQLSHQRLNARFWGIALQKENPSDNFPKLFSANSSTIKKYPLPRLIERFLEENEVFED